MITAINKAMLRDFNSLLLCMRVTLEPLVDHTEIWLLSHLIIDMNDQTKKCGFQHNTGNDSQDQPSEHSISLLHIAAVVNRGVTRFCRTGYCDDIITFLIAVTVIL